MPVRPTVHPSADVLKAFGLGKLDDSSAGVLMNHLDQCQDCCQAVASQSGDDFLDRLRQVHGRNSTPAPAKALSASLSVSKPSVSPPANPTAIPNLPPELAGNPQYDILRELGRGGMGVVYLAKNKLMDRLEVLKVVNKTLLDQPGAVERFLREIRSAAKLSHANVVAAHSAVQVGDLLAFAMEYIEGQDLAAVVKAQGPLPVPHAYYYVQQAALGLQHAFEKNMVHRDIKPQNLILAREGKKHIVKVLDFGLAKVMREKTEDSGLTGEGRMLGTPDYIAPEQTLDAASADIRADIYSLGCTLYYLLSGRPPFSAASLGAVLLAHQLQEAKLLNLVRPEVPEELAAVVRKMMAKGRAKRYQTPLQVAQALAAFIKPGATPKSSPDLSVAAPRASGIQTAKADQSIMPATEGESRKAPVSEAPPAVAWDSLTASVTASPEPRKKGTVRKRRPRAAPPAARKKWWIGGSMAAGLLLLGWLAVVVLRVETPNGTLLVEMNDDEVEARIKNGKLILTGPDGKVRYTLTPNDRSKKLEAGTYKIRVEGADGLVLDTPEFTLKKGGQVTIRVTLERKAVAKKESAGKPDDPVKVNDGAKARTATPLASLARDRKAAEYVLSIYGMVRVNSEESDILRVADLPSEAFRLTGVDLQDNKQVSDAGLAHFKDCNNLTVLWLRNTQVSDASLAHLKDCKGLAYLDLNGTPVSDAGLVHFEGCKNLTLLRLQKTKVTVKGVEELKKTLPNCRIVWDE